MLECSLIKSRPWKIHLLNRNRKDVQAVAIIMTVKGIQTRILGLLMKVEGIPGALTGIWLDERI